MKEKHVGYCDRRNGFGRTSSEPHEDTSSQETSKGLIKDGPDGAGEVYGVADNVGWPPSILVRDGNPDEVAGALEQCRCGEEVRDRGDVLVEAHWIDSGRRAGEEFQRCLHYGNSGPSCQKVAPEHGHANNRGDGFLVP